MGTHARSSGPRETACAISARSAIVAAPLVTSTKGGRVMSSDVSRREFLRTGILGSAGLVALGCRDSLGSSARALAQLGAQDSDFVPAIVIGSGFGGAVAA